MSILAMESIAPSVSGGLAERMKPVKLLYIMKGIKGGNKSNLLRGGEEHWIGVETGSGEV